MRDSLQPRWGAATQQCSSATYSRYPALPDVLLWRGLSDLPCAGAHPSGKWVPAGRASSPLAGDFDHTHSRFLSGEATDGTEYLAPHCGAISVGRFLREISFAHVALVLVTAGFGGKEREQIFHHVITQRRVPCTCFGLLNGNHSSGFLELCLSLAWRGETCPMHGTETAERITVEKRFGRFLEPRHVCFFCLCLLF